MTQDPFGTLVPSLYVVTALEALFCCRLGTLGPWEFCPGLLGCGP